MFPNHTISDIDISYVHPINGNEVIHRITLNSEFRRQRNYSPCPCRTIYLRTVSHVFLSIRYHPLHSTAPPECDAIGPLSSEAFITHRLCPSTTSTIPSHPFHRHTQSVPPTVRNTCHTPLRAHPPTHPHTQRNISSTSLTHSLTCPVPHAARPKPRPISAMNVRLPPTAFLPASSPASTRPTHPRPRTA